MSSTPAERLQALLARPGLLLMPGCHDAMSARLIEEATVTISVNQALYGLDEEVLGIAEAA